MANTCGDCTLCCKLLGVVELQKPVGDWCGHCRNTPPRGCDIYSTRPQTCRNFMCGWLVWNFPEKYKPNRSHVIISDSAELDIFVVHVDPKYPDAHTTGAGAELLKLVTEKHSVLIVKGNKFIVRAKNSTDEARINSLLKEIYQL